MAVKIVLQPVTTNLDNEILHHLAEDVSKEFRTLKVTVASSIALDKALFRLAFDKERNQWDSFKLLEWIFKKFKHNKEIIILAIFDLDAYSSAFDFVFGEAFYQGRIAAVYVPRLRQDFYGLKPNSKLFYYRLVKEAVHELGHVFDFLHCRNPSCVMHFCVSLHYVDSKERSFCQNCIKVF